MSDRSSGPVFLDTAYVVALVNRDDLLHGVAVELADRLKRDSPKLITTRAILLEIGDSLAKPQHRQVAGELLAAIDGDRERLDKGWGMTDCLSFVLMRSRGSTESLTHDGHFEQAGFRALMRRP